MYNGRLRNPPLPFTPQAQRQRPEAPAAARVLTGFAQAIVDSQGMTRGDLEDESKVMNQCQAVLPEINVLNYPDTKNDTKRTEALQRIFGPYRGFATCWLCGFPVGHTSFLKYLQANPGPQTIPIQSLEFAAWTFEYKTSVYSSSGKKRVRKHPNNDVFDRATCEHVLPIKLAVGTLGLAFEKGYQTTLGLDVHTEYEYAHNYCNYVKNNSYFVTIPLNQTNFDNMTINKNKVVTFVNTLVDNARGENATFMDGRVNINGNVLANIVQAYLYITNNYTPEAIAKYKNMIATAINERTERMIHHIQQIDKFSRTPEGISTFYQHFQSKVAGLDTEARQQQQAFIAELQKVAPEFLSRGTVPLQRSPSSAVCTAYEDCIKGLTFNDETTVSYLENRDLDISSGIPVDTAVEKYYAIKDNLYLINPATGQRFIVEDIEDAEGGKRKRNKKTQRKMRAHKKRRATRSKK
jgi:hypothetical protein